MDALREQLEAAAAAFCRSPEELRHVLAQMADDVERATAEPLTLFPVIHHSPASALHMVRLLRERRPRLVLLEACEDLRPLVERLAQCDLPVALQAYAPEPVGLPAEWSPLSVLTPLTEFSAEYQAIAYALNEPGVELCFVDRSTDQVFQWEQELLPVSDEAAAPPGGGQQVLELGRLVPSFAEFHDVLLHNARMSHFEEWSNLYIEEPTIAADTHTYRQVLFLIGSLFRRMGSTPEHRDEMCRRDRHMWTRIHETLARTDVAPEDAVFICGAAHTANDDVPEYGVASPARCARPSPTGTTYRYGVVPSSYAAIERQFGYARGAVALAAGRWNKACKAHGVTPFSLGRAKGKARRRKRKVKAARGGGAAPPQLSLELLLARPPELSEADSAELVAWSTAVVAEARRSRYLATTADAIAIYQTSILLARIRGRKRPSAYDFIDAAETCLEKSRVPGRRSIRACCEAVLGADVQGRVGYDAAPPLVRDVYDRLSVLGIDDRTRGVTRVLMDFRLHPELRDASMLLWRLARVLPGTRVARPIMGKLELGHVAQQESWDVRLSGPEQRALIELGYTALTVEQVVEERLQREAFGEDASSVSALEATEACLVLLDNPRLARSLGERVSELLRLERDAATAPALFRRARRLVYHYRAMGETMPTWLAGLVTTGFHHYAGLLPEAFGDRGTSPEQVAAVCGFLFTLEGLALSLGCRRSEVEIAFLSAAELATDPEKTGLLWVCQWLVQQKTQDEVVSAFAAVMDHPIGRRAYPRYLAGLLHAVGFAPRAADLAVEQLGRAFAELPDDVLLPFMPSLIAVLRAQGGAGLRQVVKLAKRALPRHSAALSAWEPPWRSQPAPAPPTPGSAQPVSQRARAVAALLNAHRDAAASHAAALGIEGEFLDPSALGADGGPSDAAPAADTDTTRPSGAIPAGRSVVAGAALLAAHPASASAWSEALSGALSG